MGDLGLGIVELCLIADRAVSVRAVFVNASIILSEKSLPRR